MILNSIKFKFYKHEHMMCWTNINCIMNYQYGLNIGRPFLGIIMFMSLFIKLYMDEIWGGKVGIGQGTKQTLLGRTCGL